MEMLASLSILLVICIIILPQLLLVKKEARHTEMRHTANKILKDAIVGLLNETKDFQPYEKMISGVMYEVTWEHDQDSKEKRICVRWYNTNKQWQSRCERFHAAEARTGVYSYRSSNMSVTPPFISHTSPTFIPSF